MACRKWNGHTYETVREPLTDKQRIAKLERENKKLAKKIADLESTVSCLYNWYIRQCDDLY